MFFSDNITVDRHLWFNVIPTEQSDEIRRVRQCRQRMVARSMGNAHAVRVAKRRHCQRISSNANTEISHTRFEMTNTRKTSEKYEACFSIFYCECMQYSRFTADTRTNEREIRSLLQYFLLRVHAVFAVYRNYTNQRARNMKLASVFLTASAGCIRGLPQIHEPTSEKLMNF